MQRARPRRAGPRGRRSAGRRRCATRRPAGTPRGARRRRGRPCGPAPRPPRPGLPQVPVVVRPALRVRDSMLTVSTSSATLVNVVSVNIDPREWTWVLRPSAGATRSWPPCASRHSRSTSTPRSSTSPCRTSAGSCDATTRDLQWIVDGYNLAFAGAGAHRRLARRPVRPPAGAAGRPGRLRARQRPRRDGRLERGADRGAVRDGRVRRADLPDHAVDHHERLPRPPRAGQGDRHLGCGHRPRRRDRPGHRRAAAGALLPGRRCSSRSCRSALVALVAAVGPGAGVP